MGFVGYGLWENLLNKPSHHPFVWVAYSKIIFLSKKLVTATGRAYRPKPDDRLLDDIFKPSKINPKAIEGNNLLVSSNLIAIGTAVN